MNVLVLTGAGISAESGIPTFRDADGLWEGHRAEEVATPEAFSANPALVHRFYNQRRRRVQEADIGPNEAHLALAEFESNFHDAFGGRFLLVSQNVDNLHQRAGSKNLLSMHGELLKARCSRTGDVFEWSEDLTSETPHPDRPDLVGTLRPHIVWFGEMPMGMDRIETAAAEADLFIAIGTSAVVYPAAAFVDWTPSSCYRIEINMQDTPVSEKFDETIRGKASVEVPKLLHRIETSGLPAKH
ncbi:MAG: SIR2 family NAD-dependent protein deacylase [Aureliella sp.]